MSLDRTTLRDLAAPSHETRLFLRTLRGAFGGRHLRAFMFRRGGFLIVLAMLLGAARAAMWWADGPRVGTFDPPAVRLLDPATFDMTKGEVSASRAIDPEGDLIPIFQILPPGDPNGPERTWAVWSVSEKRAIARGTEWPACQWQNSGNGLFGLGGICTLRAPGPYHIKPPAWGWVSDDHRLILAFPGWNDDIRSGPVGPSVRVLAIDPPSGAIELDRVFHGVQELHDASPSGRLLAGTAVDLLALPSFETYGLRATVLDLESGEAYREPIPADRIRFLDEDRLLCISGRYLHTWKWREDRLEGPCFLDRARTAREQEARNSTDVEIDDRLYLPTHLERSAPSGAWSFIFPSVRTYRESQEDSRTEVAQVRLSRDGTWTESPWLLGGEKFWDVQPYWFPNNFQPSSGLWLVVAGRRIDRALDARVKGRVSLIRFPEGSVHPIADAPIDLPSGRPSHEYLLVGPTTLAVCPPLEGGGGIGFYPVSKFLDAAIPEIPSATDFAPAVSERSAEPAP